MVKGDASSLVRQCRDTVKQHNCVNPTNITMILINSLIPIWFSVLEMVAESWFHILGKFPQKHDFGHNKAPLGVLASKVLSLMSKVVYIWHALSDKQVFYSHHLHYPNCIFGLLTLHLYTDVLTHQLSSYNVKPVSSNSTLEASFSPDGTYVISSSCDGSVHAWSIRTGKEVIVGVKGCYMVSNVA
ncbi:hypothetical protein LINPERPRIM_LOCUS39033 [Linum perenne]